MSGEPRYMRSAQRTNLLASLMLMWGSVGFQKMLSQWGGWADWRSMAGFAICSFFIVWALRELDQNLEDLRDAVKDESR